jgi:drug/metabolite transporter (DMT)-like permease
MKTLRPRTVANLKGIATILLWSFSALFISFTQEIPPFLLACLTSACGFALFGLRWTRDRQRFLLAVQQPPHIWVLFAVAVIAYRGFYLSGLKMAPTLEANLINYLWPLLIVLLGALLDWRQLPPRVWCGAGAGLLGVYLLTSGNRTAETGWQLGAGHIFALLGAISWAAYSVATRRFKIASSDLIGVMHFLAVVTFFSLHLIFEVPVQWERVDLLHWVAIAELGLAISLGYSWWDDAMSKGNQEQIAIGANFIPLLSTVWLVLFGHQQLTAQLFAAAGLIIGGSYVAKKSTL